MFQEPVERPRVGLLDLNIFEYFWHKKVGVNLWSEGGRFIKWPEFITKFQGLAFPWISRISGIKHFLGSEISRTQNIKFNWLDWLQMDGSGTGMSFSSMVAKNSLRVCMLNFQTGSLFKKACWSPLNQVDHQELDACSQWTQVLLAHKKSPHLASKGRTFS